MHSIKVKGNIQGFKLYKDLKKIIPKEFYSYGELTWLEPD